MAGALISDRIAVSRRYVRAVDLGRDLGDPAALDGYIVTPSVRDALVRLSAGLRPGSTQRAFRITGPYGSGKSAFALLLARILEEGGQCGPASAMLGEATGNAQTPACRPLVLVGRRTSLSDEILRTIADNAGADLAHVGSEATRLLDQRREGDRDVRPVLDLLTRFAREQADGCGRGIVLLVDEMGRFLEFAAANPAREDPSIFQLLAERAAGTDHPYFAVAGFLHHRFADYVSGLGRWVENEWARSAERYEEIAFQESTEQTLHLMARALGPQVQHSKTVRQAALDLYSGAHQRQLFATSLAAVEEAAERLYPIHPAALACLASSARRFGQNERSVFSFLQSLEPAGLQRFVHETYYDAGNWYRLDDLFDYLAGQGGTLRFRSPDRERRWQLAFDAIAASPTIAQTELRVLKALSILSVLEPVPGLRSDVSTLAWCLGLTESDASQALTSLIELGVAHRRSARGDFSLWSHTSVDLDRWYEDARLAVPELHRLDDELQKLPPARPLVAHRHYHKTGTLRTFSTTVGTVIQRQGREDGHIVVVPVHPDEDWDQVRERTRQLSALDALTLVRTRRISVDDLAQAHAAACWRWVREHCSELRIDDVARAEVDRHIAALEADLASLLAPFRDATANVGGEVWYYDGAELCIGSRAELSRLLSDICDDVFSSAPVLRNELINREKLSTAIAAARMRLLELMLTSSGTEFLGLTGAPPERTIYLSLLQSSGMHRAVDGELQFMPPCSSEKGSWAAVWRRLDGLVQADTAIGFNDIIADLAKAPYGVRAGPALVVIAAYMLHNRQVVALMERNTFQPEVTPAHFMRLAKTPANFALRRVSMAADDRVLEKLSRSLALFAEDPPPAELKAVVERLYRWWAELPTFAKISRTLDRPAQEVRSVLRKAREPIEFVYRSLPDALDARDGEEIHLTKFITGLDHALVQMADALPSLQRRAGAAVLAAFGAKSLGRLREQLEADFEDHLLELGDHRLRAFVDRARNREFTDSAWLDSIASLAVGQRLENWQDDTLDSFTFEVRNLAQRLARRLALLRQSKAQQSPITAIHITAQDGTEGSMFVRAPDAPEEPTAAAIRELLERADHPEALLIQLLEERIAAMANDKVQS